MNGSRIDSAKLRHIALQPRLADEFPAEGRWQPTAAARAPAAYFGFVHRDHGTLDRR
jgi:hypothetical protein